MYRYDTFNDDVMLELINNVREGAVNQAYIFEGPKGLNILESAKLFAAALTCKNKETAPCGKCEICSLSYAGTNPDIIYINAADKKSIGVDRIREIAKDVYIKPFEALYKVYVVEDGAELTDEAQNAMLKILEEPPEYAVFIIIVTSSSVLLPTVASRCSCVRFMPLSKEKMEKYIEQKYPEHIENTDFLVRFSGGIPKRAEDIINDSEFEPLRQAAFDMLLPLLSPKRISAYTVSDFMEENKEKAELILELWESMLRDVFLINQGAKHLVTNTDMNNKLSKLASRLPEKSSIIAINRIISAKMMLKRYVNLHILSLKLSFSIKKSLYM